MVEGLVRADRVAALVPNTEEEQAALRLSKRDLTNDLIEALLEQILAHWADAGLAGLALGEARIEGLPQS